MSEQSPPPVDQDVIELAARVVDLAREGRTGVPVGHLLDGGGDPDHGQPSARATPEFLRRLAKADLLERR